MFETEDELQNAIDERFQNLSPYEFEEFIADLFNKKGYYAFTTSGSKDYGADVIAERKNESLSIQVKRKKYNNSTGVDALKEAHWGMKNYNCTKPVVITTSYFTGPTKKSAHGTDIELWDYSKLRKEVNKHYNLHSQSRKSMPLAEGKFWDKWILTFFLLFFSTILLGFIL